MGGVASWLRRPVPLLGAGIAVAAAIVVVPGIRSSDREARALAGAVNRAYEAVPAYRSHADMGSVTMERVTHLDHGRRVGVVEDTIAGRFHVLGVVRPTGIWLRHPSRPCWTEPVDPTGLNMGKPVIPVDDVEFEGPIRVGRDLRLTTIETFSESRGVTTRRTNYRIDPATYRIRSAVTRLIGSPAGDSTQSETITEHLTAAPVIPQTTPAC